MRNNFGKLLGLAIILLVGVVRCPTSVEASTVSVSAKDQKDVYELRRQRKLTLNKIQDYIGTMEQNMKGMQDRVGSVLGQIRSLLDSNLNKNKVFKLTVDNLPVV